MINSTLLWLLAVPVILGIVLYAVRRQYPDSWMPCAIYVVVGLILTCGAFYASKGSKTADIEIWNGQVVSKERKHGTYEQPYDCRCRNVTTGSGKNQSTTRVCDTCYETHYTVNWTCNTTVQPYTIDSKDWTNRGVYLVPDPERYTIIKPGDPVAARKSYVNYIQAVPNSLFNPASADLKAKFKGLIPPYPDQVYDFYRINRFITPGWAPADAAQWNLAISNGLRTLGPKKQVNLIIVIAKTNDVSYEYALTDAWEGVNKNDVVVLIGSTEYPKIDFVRIISWTKNESFKVQLRDEIMNRGKIDQGIVIIALNHIATNFERRHMSEFAYLDGEIDPPDWVVGLVIFVLIGGAIGVWYMIPDWCGGRMRRYV